MGLIYFKGEINSYMKGKKLGDLANGGGGVFAMIQISKNMRENLYEYVSHCRDEHKWVRDYLIY